MLRNEDIASQEVRALGGNLLTTDGDGRPILLRGQLIEMIEQIVVTTNSLAWVSGKQLFQQRPHKPELLG